MGWLWFLPLPIAALLAIMFAWRPMRRTLRTLGQEVQSERARELFRLQRERLEANFLKAAAATGKPRGLRWAESDWESEVIYARERQTGELTALVGVTIRFEIVEGSDMEDLPYAEYPRSASAVFFFQRGQWHTSGKAIFNLTPAEAVEHFKYRYEIEG